MALRDTPNGYNTYEVMSALQKCIRRGMEYEAYWWAHELAINKTTAMLWNRLEVIACEDIGMGNPQAITVVHSCREAWERVNPKEKEVRKWEWSILAHPIIVMCRSKKSRSADDLSHLVWLRKEGRDPCTLEPELSIEKEHLDIPEFAFDMHTRKGKELLTVQALEENADQETFMVQHFREDGARLRRPVRDCALDGTNWTEEVCRLQRADPRIALADVDGKDEDYL